MIRNISVGIDLGSAMVRVVVGEFLKGEKNPKIIGVGQASSFGVRHGYVVNSAQAIASLRNALAQAENACGFKIKRASLALSGTTLQGYSGSGSAIISKADGEVTALDIAKAMEDAEDSVSLGNKKIIHSFPVSYRLDGKEVAGRPIGMQGTKLEVKALFIAYSIIHLEDLLEVVAECGVETTDVVAAPIAAERLCLSERQKIVGVALVDMGDQKTTVAVFENGALVSVYTFPIGSADITNDIALGLKIPLEVAENLKLGESSSDFSQKKLDEIIEARLDDIFESIDNHFKKIKRSELLPAGVVWIGGGANTPRLLELSKTALKLPAAVGNTSMFQNTKTKLREPSWWSAVGLLFASSTHGDYQTGALHSLWRDIRSSLRSLLKQLMP